MFKWWEITWGQRHFSVEVYLKGGGVIRFPKGFFKSFSVAKNVDGSINELSWETRGFGNVLQLTVNDILAVITLK